MSWSSVLQHFPLSIIQCVLTEPLLVCQTCVRPSATELNVCARKERQGATESRRDGNEGSGQPLLASPCLAVAADHPRNPGREEVAVNRTRAYLLGRSQSAPPTSVACQSSYPLPPCPVGRGGGGVGWFWSGLGLGAEVMGRASVSSPGVNPEWLASSSGGARGHGQF